VRRIQPDCGRARTFTKFAKESRAYASLAVTIEEERDEVERHIADAHSFPVDHAGNPVALVENVGQIEVPMNNVSGTRRLSPGGGSRLLDCIEQKQGFCGIGSENVDSAIILVVR